MRRRARVCLAVTAAAVAGLAGLLGRAQPSASDAVATLRVGVTQSDGPVRVQTMPLEDYVASVVAGEGQPRAGAAAQEALAIVVRTFAVANRRRHRAEGYDLCDTTHCQVLRPVHQAAQQAARATAGQLLLDHGKPAFVFYSAHNGGAPALASEVWPGATDYHPASAHDDACADEPGWSSTIDRADLERALREAGLQGSRLRGLSVVERTASERAGRLRVDGFTPAMVTAHELRMAVGRVLGWHVLRSTAFTVTRTDEGYRFEGAGFGHGVGLCVVGAGKRAARGESVGQILRAYFRDLEVRPALLTSTDTSSRVAAGPIVPSAPPATVTPPSSSRVSEVISMPPARSGGAVSHAASPAGLRLTLPAALEPERARLTDVVRRSRDEAASRAAVAPPAMLTLTVHATMDAFGSATGQPWWGAASTVGTAIDLAPVSELAQRGVLESTLRYEVAYAVVAPHLPASPAWLRVGAARTFASAASSAADGRVKCPSDAELLRPVSGGALHEAMSRAERCFRRQAARKSSWRDVR